MSSKSSKSKRPYKPANKRMLGLWIDRELMAAVSALAAHIGVNVSSVVHDALEAWVKHQQARAVIARKAAAERRGNALRPETLVVPPAKYPE